MGQVTQIPTPKFGLNQPVRFIGDDDAEAGQIVEIKFNVAVGEWEYKITSRDIDFKAKDIIHGIKNCKESELVAVTPKPAAPQEPVQPTSELNVTDTVSNKEESK